MGSTEHEQSLRELQSRLCKWLATGYISYGAFSVGMHVLQRMAGAKELTVSTTWRDMATGCVIRRGEAIAAPAPARAYEFYGALQELHGIVGLYSHVAVSEIQAQREEAAKREDRLSRHFTCFADTESDVITDRTILVFEFVPWSGYDCHSTVQEFLGTADNKEMPSWIYKKAVGGDKHASSRAQSQ